MGALEAVETVAIPNSWLLEFFAALFLVLDLCMVYIFGRWCFRKLRYAEPRELLGTSGLILIFFGLAVGRVTVWWARHEWNAGIHTHMDLSAAYTVASLVSLGGMVCCTYVFFRDWGRYGWAWMLALVLAIAAWLTFV